MAFTGNYMVTSYKRDIIRGYHKMRASGGHTYKLALYDENASFTAATTDYTGTNEITGTGYTAGGLILTFSEPTTGGTTGFVDCDDAIWSGATFEARGAMMYNTQTNDGSGTTDAVMILDFGLTRSVTAEVFRVVMPSADDLNAILRIQ